MDNQASKSAEQVADTQKLTIDRVIYLLNEWGYPEARRRFIELRSSQTASAASPVAGVSAKGDGCETGPVTELLNSMKVIDRSHRYMECRADLLTQYMYELVRLRAQPSAEGDGWIAEPTEQGWWWHADDPDAKPFMYGIMQSGTNGKMFIQYPDSRWCSDVGGLWAKATPPPLPTPPSVQEEKGSSV